MEVVIMGNQYSAWRLAAIHAVVVIFGALAGCSSQSNASKGAQQGATTGAVAGAVSGMVGSLIFGGNVVESGVKGAVYGGTAGAVAGGMSGSQRDKAQAQAKTEQQQRDLEATREKLGEDGFNGTVALAECKHDVAVAYAKTAMKSGNSDYELVGLWLEVLTEADRRDEAKARAMFPDIVAADPEVVSEAEAEAQMRTGLQELMRIRGEYGLPEVCPA